MLAQPLKALPINFMAQDPGEEVYFVLRQHYVTNVGWALLSLILLAVPFVFLPFSEKFNFWTNLPENLRLIFILFWWLAAFGFALLNYAKWYFRIFLITSTRVLDVDLVGLLYRNVTEAQLRQIQDVSHTQGGIWQIFFNFGDVSVQTAATVQHLELNAVKNPGHVHDIITDLIAAQAAPKSYLGVGS